MNRATDDFDYLVIGGGSGGIASARRARSHGARVALLEPNAMGGTCVNRGCVPKKILWNAAELAHGLADLPDYGFDVEAPAKFDYATLRSASLAHVGRINDLYTTRLADVGVDIVAEWAKSMGPGVIETASGRKLRSPHILLATGARPQVPKLEGAELGITSDDWFELTELPKRLLIIGGGYIGVELAGIARALGCQVTFGYRGSMPLRQFDELLRLCLVEELRVSGIELLSEFKPKRVVRSPRGTLAVQADDSRSVAELDAVLWAIGRVPDARAWAESAGVEFDPRGFVRVDEYQNTNVQGVYAVGDVTGRACLTPVAIAAGQRLADRLFGGQSEARLDYADIPTVVFSHPPIGTVGLSESDARKRYGDRVKCYVKRFENLYYAVTRQKHLTAMKLVTLLPDERVLGIHVIGLNADELIQGFAVALRMGAVKADLDRTVAIHPTAAEELVTVR
jgi:glutathione reductase (NADPH)